MSFREAAKAAGTKLIKDLSDQWEADGRPLAAVSVVGKTMHFKLQPLDRVKGKNRPVKGKK